ncbi:hypothetical protein H311_04480, partial [Anncaliia algerae PRA109]
KYFMENKKNNLPQKKIFKRNFNNLMMRCGNAIFVTLTSFHLFLILKFKYVSYHFYLCICSLTIEVINLLFCLIDSKEIKFAWNSLNLFASFFKFLIIINLASVTFRNEDILVSFFWKPLSEINVKFKFYLDYLNYFKTFYFLHIISCILIYLGEIIKKILFLNKSGALLTGLGYVIWIFILYVCKSYGFWRNFIGILYILVTILGFFMTSLITSKGYFKRILNHVILLVNTIFLFTMLYMFISFSVQYFELIFKQRLDVITQDKKNINFIVHLFDYIKDTIGIFNIEDGDLVRYHS